MQVWPLFALLVGVGLVLPRLLPHRALLDGVGFSQAVYDREGRLLRLTLAPDERFRLHVPLEEVAPVLVEATLLHEDQQFWRHPGVNPLTLAAGAWRTYVRGDRRVGGSTITMQLARLRWDIDSRTVGGKLLQIARALELELRYSKREILEAYLNLAPYGGNVEGVGAASLVYFDKPVDRLALPEALALALLPQSPAKRLSAYLAGAPGAGGPDPLREAREALFARWVREHPRAAETPPGSAIALRTARALPFDAPHFTDAVLADHPGVPVLRTTLDLSLQRLVERRLRAYVDRRRPVGIQNAAALLVDRRSLEVRAAVGSADFFDPRLEGQVNGTRAKRSPGSALKPFIYALGVEQGVIHPRTMLKDAPASFGGYNPENFDSQFAGPVSAQQALVRSRNVPAVWVASQLRAPTLHGLLAHAGVAGLRSEDHYGLSLVLGAAEVTMEELVALYAMLGNGGVLRPLRTLQDAPVSAGTRLLGAEASFATVSMLLENPRPAQAWHNDWARDPVSVAWKTGTSHGYRDAWAVGLAGPYVLAVWIGNFDARPNPAFVGAEAAAPLLFEIVDALRAREPLGTPLPSAIPEGLVRVEVCAVSGALPGPHCRATVPTWYLPGRSPIDTCAIHRQILVDARTGRRACTPSGTTVPEVYEFWPSDLLRIFRLAGIPRRSPPADGPDCTLAATSSRGEPPRITSPQEGVTYGLRAANIGKESIALLATTDADARELFWFANEKLLGRVRSTEAFFWFPTPGRFVVRAVDEQGRAGARPVRVEVVP